MLAVNIIDHPEEEKHHRFKPTNNVIRRKIADPKGSLEYTVEIRATCSFLSHSEAHLTSFVCPARIQARGKPMPGHSFPLLGLIIERGRRFPTGRSNMSPGSFSIQRGWVIVSGREHQEPGPSGRRRGTSATPGDPQREISSKDKGVVKSQGSS